MLGQRSKLKLHDKILYVNFVLLIKVFKRVLIWHEVQLFMSHRTGSKIWNSQKFNDLYPANHVTMNANILDSFSFLTIVKKILNFHLRDSLLNVNNPYLKSKILLFIFHSFWHMWRWCFSPSLNRKPTSHTETAKWPESSRSLSAVTPGPQSSSVAPRRHSTIPRPSQRWCLGRGKIAVIFFYWLKWV